MNKINFTNLPSTNTPLNADNLNAMQDNIEDAIEKLEGGKLLWEGAMIMNEFQHIDLSERISQLNNGLILIWAPYNNITHEAQEWGLVHTFISKLQLQYGNSVSCPIFHTDFSLIACKVLYIGDNIITGKIENAASGTRNGITFNNADYVLRAVVGV